MKHALTVAALVALVGLGAGIAVNGSPRHPAEADVEVASSESAEYRVPAHQEIALITEGTREVVQRTQVAEGDRLMRETVFFSHIEAQRAWDAHQLELWFEAERQRIAAEEAEAERQRQVEAERRRQQQAAQAPAHGTGRCGGDLPPCYVMMRESGGDLRVWNGGCYAPVGYRGGSSPCGGSTASGKWQFIRGTWGGFGGYVNAADAPESVQDERARQLWAGGRGCGHWAACG